MRRYRAHFDDVIGVCRGSCGHIIKPKTDEFWFIANSVTDTETEADTETDSDTDTVNEPLVKASSDLLDFDATKFLWASEKNQQTGYCLVKSDWFVNTARHRYNENTFGMGYFLWIVLKCDL